MNAVNLIPADRRKANVNVSASPVTLGLIGGLVVLLVAAVLYVLAANDVKSRQSELARVTANAASWQAAANSYASYVTAAQQRKQQIADVHQLVAGRFPWSTLLSQIGGVMPANAALSSLQAQSPSADATAASGTSAAGSTTTPTSTTGSAVSIAGCAASQSAVAATMVALNRVHGVSSVSLVSSSAGSGSSASSSSSSSSGSSGEGGCPFSVTFSLTLVLGSSATSASSGGSTPAAQTSAATSAAATTTTPTGAVQ